MQRPKRGLLWGAALVCGLACSLQADTLTDNLSAVTTATETASGDTWLTASFGTDASAYTLNSITLLLAESSSRAAELDLYSDGGLQPGSEIAVLSSPSNYSSSVSPTVFTTSGITLSADSTYWVVLKSSSGSFDWAWTTDNTGTGSGFQDTWGITDDGGATWFTYDLYPVQFSVDAAAVATPEPGTAVLLIAGGLLAAMLLRRTKESGNV